MFVFVQGGKDELDITSECDDRLEKLKRMREALKQNHAQSLANASTNNTSYKVMGERYRYLFFISIGIYLYISFLHYLAEISLVKRSKLAILKH